MTDKKPSPKAGPDNKNKDAEAKNTKDTASGKKEEIGGFGEKGNKMPEPTRFGDWEVKGRCSDF